VKGTQNQEIRGREPYSHPTGWFRNPLLKENNGHPMWKELKGNNFPKNGTQLEELELVEELGPILRIGNPLE